MAKYETLQDFMESPDHLDATAYIDSDQTQVYDNATGEVLLLDLHPAVMLVQALDLLRIPHEGV